MKRTTSSYSLQQVIEERETNEALESRYNKTLDGHRWTSLENISSSLTDLICKYISECEKEDEGVYRNHIFKLTPYQRQWKDWLMKKEYKYMITIKLPHRTISGFKRTKKQSIAVEQLRKLIRDIEKAYTGHKHWENDGFDFKLVFEHGKAGYWHAHLVVVANTMNYETYYNRLEYAIRVVLQKYQLFKTCIKLTYVYEQEGLCMYLVKELENPDNNHLEKEYSYVSDLCNLFHIKLKNTGNPIYKIIKKISAAVKSSKRKSVFVSISPNKSQPTALNIAKSSKKRAINKRFAKSNKTIS